MTFTGLMELFEAAATTVDASATFVHGRINDVSLDSHTANQNLIYVLHTMRGQPNADNVTETWTIEIGFFRQDSTSSEAMEANQEQADEESREVIFTETLTLARRFYDALLSETDLQITGQPAYSQVTRYTQGTYTGWGLSIQVLLAVGCDYGTEIADAIYQNKETAPTFQQSIKRGVVYVAPQITVTDSDGSEYQHPANTNVVCTPSASPAIARLEDTAENFISSTSIDPGTTEPITAPDAVAELENTLGAALSSTNIRSNASAPIVAPNGTANVEDQDGNSLGSDNAIPSGGAKTVVVTVPKTWTIEIEFESGDDTYVVTPRRSGTISSQAFSGASTDATYDGDAFAVWDKALTINVAITIVRNSSVAAETLTLTGTYA